MRKQPKILKLLCLLGITMFIFTGCGNKKIDLSEYINVKYSGINGKATATVDFNMIELEKILMDGEHSDINTLLQLAQVEESIDCTLDKTEGLSNGDKITASVTWSKEVAKKYKISFVEDKLTVDITGLEEGKQVDLFQDIEIDYIGISPEVEVTVRNISQSDYISSIVYHVENPTGVANGEEIKVLAECDIQDAESKGYLITETEKIYVVEGLDEYVGEFPIIDENTLLSMDSAARTLIDSKLLNNYEKYMYPDDILLRIKEYTEVVEIKQVCAYFFKLKDGCFSNEVVDQPGNRIYLFYEVTTKDALSPKGKTTYFPVCFSDIIKKANGEIVIGVEPEIQYLNRTGEHSYNRLGYTYTTLEEAQDSIVANKNDYNCEKITY